MAIGGGLPVAIGLAVGAATYFTLDRIVEQQGPGAGPALALGSLLDGIPEQMVSGSASPPARASALSLLAAIFVSNLPEAIGASTDLRQTEPHAAPRSMSLWGARRRRLHGRDRRRLRASRTPRAATSAPTITASRRAHYWSCSSTR